MKLVKIFYTLLFIIASIALLGFFFWPFAKPFIYSISLIGGDSFMHLANIVQLYFLHPFPFFGWQGMWFGGYPLIEGYPWVNYYLVLPLVAYLKDAPTAMEYYSVAMVFVYILVAFLLFLYVSKNKFFALLAGLVLVFAADTSMSLFVSGFFVFVVNQFFLPLILLVIIAAHRRESKKLLILGAVLLAASLLSHASLTVAIITPAIIPFLLLDKNGKISKDTVQQTLVFVVIFGFLSTIQIYQYIMVALKGAYGATIPPLPFSEFPARFVFMLSWQNPLLLGFLCIFLPLLLILWKRKSSALLPYVISFIFIFTVFMLLVFKLTSFAPVLFAERIIWAVSLTFLVLCSAIIGQMGKKSHVAIGLMSLIVIIGYCGVMLTIRPRQLLPKTALQPYPKVYLVALGEPGAAIVKKYQKLRAAPSWSRDFTNYRVDGLDYISYSQSPLVSLNPRYKGWYSPLKGLPLDWSGLLTAGEYGFLGPAGTPDKSQEAINQSIFFLDWYGIGYLEEVGDSLATYLKTKPILDSTETSTGGVVYHRLNPNLVGPMYAPTNAKVVGVIAPEKQYDSFIRTLSLTKFSTQKMIPIYLGDNMGALNKNTLRWLNGVVLFGYHESFFPDGTWGDLLTFVQNGGNVFIETGQAVSQTENSTLPEVFPINSTEKNVIRSPWTGQLKDSELLTGIRTEDFSPLQYKYLPYTISQSPGGTVKSWAKPILEKDGAVVMASGEIGSGKVVWSGLNLPFQAVDTKNISEDRIIGNMFQWFFPDDPQPVSDFTFFHPDSEHILVRSAGAKGILIKENESPGWHATLNKENVPLYTAGLFEMYVPLPNTSETFDLALTYTGEPIYWILTIETALVFLIVMLYLIFPVNIFTHPHVTRLRNKIKLKKPSMKSFIGEEDE